MRIYGIIEVWVVSKQQWDAHQCLAHDAESYEDIAALLPEGIYSDPYGDRFVSTWALDETQQIMIAQGFGINTDFRDWAEELRVAHYT